MNRPGRKLKTYDNQKKRFRELFPVLTSNLPFPVDGGHDLLHLDVCSFVGGEVPSKCVGTFEGQRGVMSLAALSDDTIVSGGYDNIIKLWNRDGKCIETLIGHDGMEVASLAVLSDDTIVSGNYDDTIKLWNRDETNKMKCITTLKGHTDDVNSLAVLSDDIIVSASDDRTIKLWNRRGCVLIP